MHVRDESVMVVLTVVMTVMIEYVLFHSIFEHALKNVAIYIHGHKTLLQQLIPKLYITF